MEHCTKHDIPFDEMGYCQLGCSGWEQLKNRITELEEKYESTGTKCHGGHVNNLPLALWDCPMCTTELRAKVERLVIALKKLTVSDKVIERALEGEK